MRQVADGIAVEITLPRRAAVWRYLLIDRSQIDKTFRNRDIEQIASRYDATPIIVPARRIATMSTTHVAAIAALGQSERIVAHNGLRWIYNDDIRRDRIVDVGVGGLDIERLLAAAPDITIAFPTLPELSTLERLQFPLLINAEYLETEPLGRSEWLLLFGHLLGMPQQAAAIFAEIATNYENARRLIADRLAPSTNGDAGANRSPIVMTGAPWGSQWATAGGDSYEAMLIAAAGGTYLWNDNSASGPLFVDIETMLARAQTATIWINSGPLRSREDVRNQARWIVDTTMFQNSAIYNNDNRQNRSGGTDYFEAGAIYADQILLDLAAIFHPSLFPDRSLFFYRRLD